MMSLFSHQRASGRLFLSQSGPNMAEGVDSELPVYTGVSPLG